MTSGAGAPEATGSVDPRDVAVLHIGYGRGRLAGLRRIGLALSGLALRHCLRRADQGQCRDADAQRAQQIALGGADKRTGQSETHGNPHLSPSDLTAVCSIENADYYRPKRPSG